MIEQEDLFNGLFGDNLQINEKRTVSRAKALLKNYKKLTNIASVVKQPSITQSLNISEPSFSIGQLLGDSTDKNQISQAVEKQMIAQTIVTDIVNGINNIYVNSGEPTAYYKRLLYTTYLDFDIYNHMQAMTKLAKEFPNRVEGVTNDVMLEEHIFYYDLNKALIGFAHSYKSNETQNLLVFKDE